VNVKAVSDANLDLKLQLIENMQYKGVTQPCCGNLICR